MYYCKILKSVVLNIIAVSFLSAQGNCLIYDENSGERKACELSYEAITYKQGSYESQKLFDKAIEVGPDYAYAYYQKSVPFFKRGLFSEGLQLINKAIDLNPKTYLFYRAYWYFENRSYEYCIKDLELLYLKHDETFITTPGGDLEMRLILGMAYGKMDRADKGIEWVEHLMNFYKEEERLKGLFDHYVLGILYYQNEQYDKAKEELQKQIKIEEDFADTYYYLGLIEEHESNRAMAKKYFKMAFDKVNDDQRGHSKNYFEEYNLSKSEIEKKLKEY